MIFTLARIASALNSTNSEFRDAAGALITPALERGRDMAEHPRIAAGVYPIAFRAEPSKFDASFQALLGGDYRGIITIRGVPGRSNIEFHTANNWRQLEGCVAPGLSVILGADREYGIPGGASSPAFKKLYLALAAAMLKEPCALAVVDEPVPQNQSKETQT